MGVVRSPCFVCAVNVLGCRVFGSLTWFVGFDLLGFGVIGFVLCSPVVVGGLVLFV